MDGLDVDGAPISLLTTSSSRVTLWATDATAELLEDRQFTLNEGVRSEAAGTGRPVLVPDLNHSTRTARWPAFAAAVAERTSAGALFALPLQRARSASACSTCIGPRRGTSVPSGAVTSWPPPTPAR